jgi:hypothetical protein
VVGVPWLKWVIARGRFEAQTLVVLCNAEGRLISLGTAERQQPLGGGSALQLLWAVLPLVDTSGIRQDTPQHRWGTALLERLPVTLNAAQSPDSGQHGVQQSDAPTVIGPQTLEMTPPATRTRR